MNKKISTEIAVGIILLVGIVFGVIFWLGSRNISEDNQARTNITSSPKLATDQESVLTSNFGFQLNIPSGWRLAKQISPVAASERNIQDKYSNEINSLDLNSAALQKFEDTHKNELNQMISSWSSENSTFLILTKVSIDEEKSVLSNPQALANEDLSKNINIEVEDTVGDYTNIKEVNDDKHTVKILSLKDGLVAKYVYLKSMKNRLVQFPINTQKVLANGKVAKEILIETGENSMSEDDFINFVKQIKITK